MMAIFVGKDIEQWTMKDQMIILIIDRSFNTTRWSDISLSPNTKMIQKKLKKKTHDYVCELTINNE